MKCGTVDSYPRGAAVLIRNIPMKKFLKVAALAALVAIPLIIVAKTKNQEKGLVPVSGDESDLFDWELSAD